MENRKGDLKAPRQYIRAVELRHNEHSAIGWVFPPTFLRVDRYPSALIHNISRDTNMCTSPNSVLVKQKTTDECCSEAGCIKSGLLPIGRFRCPSEKYLVPWSVVQRIFCLGGLGFVDDNSIICGNH